MKSETKTILIREHETDHKAFISDVPVDAPSHRIVEAWQKSRPKTSGITWKIAESNDIGSVLVELAKL